MDPEIPLRSTTLLRHRARAAAHRIVTGCELLLSDTAHPDWRLWRDAIGEALLAGHQLRTLVERRFQVADVVLSREQTAELHAELREPQHRIIQAMTRVLTLVPTDLNDELLLEDARTIRDVALRLGSDETIKMKAEREPARHDHAGGRPSNAGNGSRALTVVPRVLVVDDTEAMRKVITRLLDELGYDVASAANGLEAIAIAERERVDVIVTDIQMPECDGFALIERLKALDATREIPVIVVSGLDDIESVVRCVELGAEDHLPKPFNRLLLQARVRASLERKRLRDQELGYLRRVAQLTVAAEEVESSTYLPGSLGQLSGEDDELARLARVFDRVASGWQAREVRLQRRIRQFKDEISQSRRRPSMEIELLSGFGVFASGDDFAGRYDMIEELGRGGMGVVYRARDRELGDEVAIKVLRAELLKTDPSLIERLKSEIRLARRITHPNVVRSHDFGEWHGMHYLTMEYIKGITVEDLIETQGRLSMASTLAIGTQLAEALVVAHDQQIIHRDIKPANLLVNNEGILKVTDFGLARPIKADSRITEHGAVVGTPRYMAPEQLFGNEVDARTDLFSVGAVLYECLTGMPPFDADSPTAIVARLVDGPPAPIERLAPEVTPAVAALVFHLLQYEPKDRMQSARELVERLREVH